MANDFSGRQWHVDTASPGTVVWQGAVKILAIEFSKYASGNEVILKDKAGKVILDVVGPADLEPVKISPIGWVNGLIVDTLAGGILTIYTA